MDELKLDSRNYRIHDERNKELIKKSLIDCGAGRSVVADADGVIIAGNGIFEQAKALNIPTRIIETDGTEVVAVKRKDLEPKSTKRKRLALLDNYVADTSEMNYELLREDLQVRDFFDLGLEIPNVDVSVQSVSGNESFTDDEIEQLGDTVQNQYLTPEKLEQIQRENPDINNRIIICFKRDEKEQLEKILGIRIEKVLYSIVEIMGA